MNSRDIKSLSTTAQRWLAFLGCSTCEETAAALRARIIAPLKRPGLTPAVVREIEEWVTPSQDAEPSPAPIRIAKIVNCYQCNVEEHLHRDFDEAVQCMRSRAMPCDMHQDRDAKHKG